ncbi:protein_serine/threonine kinase [Hexamita inflata]|uniref:Putative n=1 Tax=Hexamita inflata TaxID=28002 RepID=A0AA86QPA8_9EUKA|nr:protein serine/threonine kinase [Hexamita inflata]
MNGLCKCPDNSKFENGNCVCQPTNSLLDNGICACDSNSFKTSLSGQTLTCQACPSGATSDSGRTTCICSGNYYYKSDNTCNKCPDNSVISNNVCVCDSHSYEVSSSNGLPTCFKCPDSATPDQSGKTCTCPNNNFYTSSNNSCTTCGANSTVSSNICVCNANSYEVSNNAGSLVCFTCPVNSVSQNDSKTCICDGNYFYKSSDNICVECPEKSLVAQNVCTCISTAFQVSVTDSIPVCKICPVQSHPNAEQTTCVCDSYFQYNSGTNTCQACPLNYYYVLATNLCVPCDSGKFYNSSNNVCVACLVNSFVSGNGCTCNSDSFQVSKVDGVATCTKCLDNSHVNGTECVCNADSYQTAINSGVVTCTQCTPEISDINGDQTSCVCKNDYFYSPSDNSCIACPDHSKVSNNICYCVPEAYTESVSGLVPKCFLCPANSNPDNTTKTCVCNGNFFYSSSNNTCTTCGANSTVSSNICVCNANSYEVSNNAGSLVCFTCPVNSVSQNDSKTCICDGNYFYKSSDNICVECPEKSLVAQNVCTCISTAFQVSVTDSIPVCKICPVQSHPNAEQTTCVCDSYFQYNSGTNTCQACPLNYYYVLATNLCVPCDSGKFYNSSNNVCVACLVNSFVSGNGCTCNSDSFQVSKVDGVATCTKCPAASAPNAGQTTCVCNTYFQYISFNNTCQSCPYNNQYVLATNSCVPCPMYTKQVVNNVCICHDSANTKVVNNICTCNMQYAYIEFVKASTPACWCPYFSYNNSVKCICNTGGYVFDVGISPQTCVASASCTAPRTVVNSVCTCNQATGSCPIGATWDASACKCKCTAQYKNGNTVLPYSFWGLVEGTTTSSNMKCCSSDKNYGSSTQQSIYYQCQDSAASTIYTNNNNKWVCGGDTCEQFTWTRS